MKKKRKPRYPRCLYTPNKKQYGTRAEAEQKLAEIRAWYANRADTGLVVATDTPTRAYLCESCNLWHLTSKEKR